MRGFFLKIAPLKSYRQPFPSTYFSYSSVILCRPEQHHWHHCLHLQQCRRSKWQERWGQEEPVQLRLVLLLWGPLLHRGWVSGRSCSQHIHWKKQRDTLPCQTWLHQNDLILFTILSHTKLPLQTETLTLQFEVNWPIPWAVPSGNEDWWRVWRGRVGDGSADGGYIPVYIQQGPIEGWKWDCRALQPWEGYWVFTSPQLLSERCERWSKPKNHASMRSGVC